MSLSVYETVVVVIYVWMKPRSAAIDLPQAVSFMRPEICDFSLSVFTYILLFAKLTCNVQLSGFLKGYLVYPHTVIGFNLFGFDS